MGKPTGFLETPRRPPARRDRRERLGDWREVYLPQAEDEARAQAGRCMDCGVPFCQSGCPLGNVIPDWNDLVHRGRWRAAYDRLASTNNFPELTGRLCPAPCEAACVLAIEGTSAPVTIEQVEHEIAERAWAEGWVVPRPPTAETGRHVAIVGSGPAGLAAAQELRRAGHRVTVYEADERPGGMLRFGIPDFKLEKHPLERRLAQLEAEGIEIRCGVSVGRDVGWTELRAGHDALLLALGARRARELDVPGRDLDGVVLAMDYLAAQNRALAGAALPPALDASGKHVVILGGGDTGSDCHGTALRQGAASVRAIQIWPAPPAERAADNPWPEWPLVFRTSSSQEEGGERDFAIVTRRLAGEGGRVRALEAAPIDVVVGEDGRRRAVPRPGGELVVPADLVILAIGFAGPELAGAERLGVGLDGRGNLAVDGELAAADGVFAAGDAIRGASLLVWAIADGRRAARAIERYLAAVT